MKLNRTGSNWNELERNKINENWGIIEGLGGTLSKLVTGLVWKEPVDTVGDLPANAEVGETRMVREADPDGISYVYRYDGENWEKIQAIDVTLVNEVDTRLTRQLTETEQQLDATANQVAQIQTDKADITYVDALISNITDGSPKELIYSIGALNDKYPNGAVGTLLVFDASLEDGAHAFIWDGTEWIDTGVYQAKGIKDNAVTTSKLSDEIALKGYPFFNNANPPVDMRKAVLSVKIYDADKNKRYSIGILQKNRSSQNFTGRYRIEIYEITSGEFGDIVSTFLEDDYIPTSNIEIIKLTGALNAEVVIKWSELPDETSLTGMPYSTGGLHPLTYINQVDVRGLESRLVVWEDVLTTEDEEWVV